MLDFLLLHFVCLLLNFTVDFLLLPKEGIIPVINRRFLIFDFNDLCHNAVKEIAVVGNNQHCTGIGAKEILQPFDCRNVQMVGRLVQQQDIRLGKQQLCQMHACFLSAGKLIHRAVEIIVGKAKRRRLW